MDNGAPWPRKVDGKGIGFAGRDRVISVAIGMAVELLKVIGGVCFRCWRGRPNRLNFTIGTPIAQRLLDGSPCVPT